MHRTQGTTCSRTRQWPPQIGLHARCPRAAPAPARRSLPGCSTALRGAVDRNAQAKRPTRSGNDAAARKKRAPRVHEHDHEGRAVPATRQGKKGPRSAAAGEASCQAADQGGSANGHARCGRCQRPGHGEGERRACGGHRHRRTSAGGPAASPSSSAALLSTRRASQRTLMRSPLGAHRDAHKSTLRAG
jgi:hypothetical protein